ncbi:uncharacterized protein Triagg1_5793 [Trichoderma aggressivum f. europaeum]|uniref:Uncharacterized protein n=1 Tax=Trichoderma aggressivum f. europaeum TaxID=173218 RepID=A0AAE1IE41_9HYPO|nr:hypothetical protein Triagg1_5793 [Trichoderma aggressivum f. europaeum]
MGDLRVFKGLVARDHPVSGFGIYSTANTLIAETTRAWNPEPTFKTQKVLGRCLYMMPSSTKTEPPKKNTKSEPAPYMGLSTNLQGAVFATKAVRKKKGEPSDNEILGQASDINKFNFRGVDFKVTPKHQWAGQCFLPHYLSTSPANLTAYKRLASGEPLESILPDPQERKRYLKEYEEFSARLKQGKAPRPPALVPISAADDTAGLYGPSDTVPKTTQKSCNASVLKRDEEAFSGHQFEVPYLAVLQFPEELLYMLEAFAAAHPHDHLPMPGMLITIIQWKDILKSDDRLLEEFMRTNKRNKRAYSDVPIAHLAFCLIYNSHRIRYTEWAELAEFPHLLRFTHRAIETDLLSAGWLDIDETALDQQRIFELLDEVKSVVPGISPGLRLTIMPWQMPGTKMPGMYGPGSPPPIEPIEMALTGLTSVSYYGIPDYSPPGVAQDGSDTASFSKHYKLGDKYVNLSLPEWAWDDCKAELTDYQGRSAADFRDDFFYPHWEVNKLHSPTYWRNKPKAPPEADYPRYKEMMQFWAQHEIHAHLSWAEGKQEAKRLAPGHRSLSKLRYLVMKAMYDEEGDVAFIRNKIDAVSERHPIQQDDIERNVPLALGRLLGLEAPDDDDVMALRSCVNLWYGYYNPRSTTMRGLGLAFEYSTGIMNALKLAQVGDPATFQRVRQEGTKWLDRFVALRQDARYVRWLNAWRSQFPEVMVHDGDAREHHIPPVPEQQSLQPPSEPAFNNVDETARANGPSPSEPAPQLTPDDTSLQPMLAEQEPTVEQLSTLEDNSHSIADHGQSLALQSTIEQSDQQMLDIHEQIPAPDGQASTMEYHDQSDQEMWDIHEQIPAPDGQASTMEYHDQSDQEMWDIHEQTPAPDGQSPSVEYNTPDPEGHAQLPEVTIGTPDEQDQTTMQASTVPTESAWTPPRVLSMMKELVVARELPLELAQHVSDLSNGWNRSRSWPDLIDEMDLILDLISDTHPKPIPPHLAEAVADWERNIDDRHPTHQASGQQSPFPEEHPQKPDEQPSPSKLVGSPPQSTLNDQALVEWEADNYPKSTARENGPRGHTLQFVSGEQVHQSALSHQAPDAMGLSAVPPQHNAEQLEQLQQDQQASLSGQSFDYQTPAPEEQPLITDEYHLHQASGHQTSETDLPVQEHSEGESLPSPTPKSETQDLEQVMLLVDELMRGRGPEIPADLRNRGRLLRIDWREDGVFPDDDDLASLIQGLADGYQGDMPSHLRDVMACWVDAN